MPLGAACTSRSAIRMSPGDCLWVRVDKDRAAIVIKRMAAKEGDPPETERWMVVVGYGSPPTDGRCVKISHNERTGMILRLSKPTHFYRVALIRNVPEIVLSNPGRCLPSTLYALEELIGVRPPGSAPT